MKEKLTVVKVGGQIVEETETLNQLLDNFSKLDGFKVLIHGGGRSATKIASLLGVETEMVNGRRITSLEMLKVVTMVYAGLVNKEIVASLQAKSINALGLTGADLNYMVSEKRPVKDVDYGYVGDVTRVNTSIICDLIHKNIVPVLAPLTHDGKGKLLNTNADTIASEAAIALSQEFDVTLVYCFEKNGVLLDANDDDSVIPVLNNTSFKQYVDSGVINAGMIPKLENSFNSISKGVSRVLITNSKSLSGSGGTLIME